VEKELRGKAYRDAMNETNRVTISLNEREEMLNKAKAKAFQRGKEALKIEFDQREEKLGKENMQKWRREIMLEEEHQRAHENAAI
jgi:preprotein translocase subunit SecA